MARQEIILGTAPTGLGGDPPRTASTKINAMTLELYAKNATLGTAASKTAQTNPKANSGELLVAGINGVGSINILEGTIYATGLPSDLFSTGFCQGFCSGGALNIPGFTTGNYGVLTSKMHWVDAAGGGSNLQEWSAGQVKYIRFPASASAWGAWILVGAQLVGTSGTGLNQSVIERGSNGNGEYVRLIDGTQLCWCVSTGYTANTAKTGTFPMSFLAATTTTVTASVTPVGAIDMTHTAWPGGSGTWTFISSITDASNQIKIMAVGRWK